MGCGCAKKHSSSTSPATKAKTSQVKKASGVSPVPRSEAVNEVQVVSSKKINNPECIGMYDQLSVLDRKIVALHNKFRFSQMGYRYAETQKIIRGMLIDLKNNCPEEDEFSAVRDFVNEEYSKYFNISR